MRSVVSDTGSFISKKIGKAIRDYGMIEEGDRILLGLSGGKDSMTLLKLLKERQSWSPVRYELAVGCIESDMECDNGLDKRRIGKITKNLGVRCVLKKIEIKEKSKGKEAGCFWCSWNRRKALFNMAHDMGYNKVALGHTRDDIIETTLINLFFQGHISTMNPKQPLFSGALVVIRPLCYVDGETARRFARETGYLKGRPRTGKTDTTRSYVRRIIKDAEKRCPNVKTNIYRSISRVRAEYIDLR